MEISYFYECDTLDSQIGSLKCLEVKLVAFEFVETFQLDYENLESETSIYLWNELKPLLEKTFGDIQVELSLVNLREGFFARNLREESIIVYVETLSIRNRKNPTEKISNKNIISLLQNDKKSCTKFLGYNSTYNEEENCWKKRAERIFLEKGFKFRGVYLNPTKTPQSATTTRTEFKFAESRNIKFQEENNDPNSVKSMEIWKIINPLLGESFGSLEVDLYLSKIRSGEFKTDSEIIASVIIEVDIKPIRNRKNPDDEISSKDIISLLKNDEESCRKFLENNFNDENDQNCWKQHTTNIFTRNNISFLGVSIMSTPPNSLTTSLSTTISENLSVTMSDNIIEVDTTTASKSPISYPIFVQWGDWNEWSGWNPTCYDDSADSIYKDSSKYYPKRSRTRDCIRTENDVNITIAVNDGGENCPIEDKIEREKDTNHAMGRFQSNYSKMIPIHKQFRI